MAIIDELLVGLGFDYDPKGLDQFRQGIGKTTQMVKQFAAVAAAGAAAVTGLVVATTAATDAQGKLAEETGINVETIDALSFALKLSGGNADSMGNSLRQLSIRTSEAARGTGSAVEAFGILGISVTDTNGNLRDTTDLFLDVSKQMQGLTQAEQIELADKLGLADSIRLLQQGPDAIRGLIDEAHALGVTTAEDAAISAEFQDSLASIWQIVKQLSRTLTAALVPIMQDLADQFIAWWKVNRELIEQNLPRWLDQITFAIKLMVGAFAAFLAMRIVSSIIGIIKVIRALQVSVMLVNAAVLLIPALIAAAVIAFALLAEDAMGFFSGQDSVIGDMLKKYPAWEAAIKSVASIFAALGDTVKFLFDTLVDLFTLDFSSIGDRFSDLASGAVDAAKDLFFGDEPVAPGQARTSAFLDERNAAFNTAAAAVAGQNGVGGFMNTNDSFNAAGVTPPPAGVASGGSGVTVDKLELNVSGAGDPKAVASEVVNQLKQTAQDLDTVVDQ